MRISDSALVDAAVLSSRYIADRFLPDKAIDLIDESAAKLKMEITSKPLALDEIDRKVSIPWKMWHEIWSGLCSRAYCRAHSVRPTKVMPWRMLTPTVSLAPC